MKNLLIRIFCFPWKVDNYSNSWCICSFFSMWLLMFIILIYPVYLMIGLMFKGEPFAPFIAITFFTNLILSVIPTGLYPQIADPLMKKLKE